MQNTLNTLFQQWAWDILYPLDGQNQFIGSDGFERSEIARLIGAENWFNEENPYDPAAARRRPPPAQSRLRSMAAATRL